MEIALVFITLELDQLILTLQEMERGDYQVYLNTSINQWPAFTIKTSGTFIK